MIKSSYSIQDWLGIHGLTSREVQEYCNIISNKLQPREVLPSPHQYLAFSLGQCLEYFVFPSLKRLLSLPSRFDRLLGQVKFVQYKLGEIRRPYAEYSHTLKCPVIHIEWSGAVNDLTCLAHEVAHAVQILLSKNSFMPPIAREVCAFLGELALIEFVNEQRSTLCSDLRVEWHRHNQHYLSRDVAVLVDGLRTIASSRYTYQHNYPLARVVAMVFFATKSPSEVNDLFSSGAGAMDKIDFQKIKADIDRSCTAFKKYTYSKTDEDICSFQMSLSPLALKEVSSGQIDYAWLYTSASVGYVASGNYIEKEFDFPRSLWPKWRSFGVIALALLQRNEADILPGVFIETFQTLASKQPSQDFVLSSPWVKPMKFDALVALGMIIQQLATSPYHQQFKLSHYLPVEILPPLKAKQLRCYIDSEGNPLGVITWAWLSEREKQQIHKTGRALKREEWVNGEHPFVNDWITESVAFRAVMTEMRDVIFPDFTVSSLRRTPDGGIRRVNKWVGRNLQKKRIANSSKT